MVFSAPTSFTHSQCFLIGAKRIPATEPWATISRAGTWLLLYKQAGCHDRCNVMPIKRNICHPYPPQEIAWSGPESPEPCYTTALAHLPVSPESTYVAAVSG